MAATTFIVTATFTKPDGSAATGTVTFKANNLRETNTSTLQDAMPITATLNPTTGAISQTLVVNVGGYTVTESISGSSGITYVIPGIANIDLSTVDASTANFDASDVVNVVPRQTVSATTYTFALADGANVEKAFTASSAVTATIDGNVAIPVGTVISGIQMGTGKVTVVATNGATLVSAGSLTGTRVRYSPFQIRKDTSTQWVMTGDLG